MKQHIWVFAIVIAILNVIYLQVTWLTYNKKEAMLLQPWTHPYISICCTSILDADNAFSIQFSFIALTAVRILLHSKLAINCLSYPAGRTNLSIHFSSRCVDEYLRFEWKRMHVGIFFSPQISKSNANSVPFGEYIAILILLMSIQHWTSLSTSQDRHAIVWLFDIFGAYNFDILTNNKIVCECCHSSDEWHVDVIS